MFFKEWKVMPLNYLHLERYQKYQEKWAELKSLQACEN